MHVLGVPSDLRVLCDLAQGVIVQFRCCIAVQQEYDEQGITQGFGIAIHVLDMCLFVFLEEKQV